ncbi:MAG: hypothetical protein KF746_09380 [Chitinophagaceae bacterium]|nr:hypothetical protein [Chitinophagaceae bacterium]
MNDAKIQLSEEELHLALNAGWILTKNRIVEKICRYFGDLANCYRQYSGDVFSFLPVMQSPKIAKGEHYNGLPYVMLDYPRHFTQTDILAVRTMFWWGNDMSITLHLKGKYKEKFALAVTEALAGGGNDWYFQAHDDEWLHHFSNATHIPLNETNRQLVSDHGMPFVKLSSFLPLKRWNGSEDVFSEKFRQLVNAMKDQLPSR